MKRNGSDEMATLWLQYRKSKSTAIRNTIVEKYVPLVNKMAEIMARRLWPRVSADELASAGYGRTDRGPSRHLIWIEAVKFETYCRQRIVGAIRDWQREIDPLGRSGRTFERSLNAVEEKFKAERGEAATIDELAGEMGLPIGKFMKMKRTVVASHCVPLETPAERRNDSRVSTLVAHATRGPARSNRTERELIRDYLTRGLKEQDRLIITLYYYERLTDG